MESVFLWVCSLMSGLSLITQGKFSLVGADSDVVIWVVYNWVVFHLCRYACKYAQYLLSVALL